MRRNKFFFVYSALLVTTILWGINLVSAATTIYGPRKFIRSAGKPVLVTESFSAPSATTYNLILLNGDKGKNQVSSATVKINGIEILRESDFNQQVDRIERSVNLLLSNSISVELKSAPGSFIMISITSENPKHPPVAQDQTITTDEDAARAINLAATDPDGDSLTYVIVAQPANGALSGIPPNITYTPTAHFYGSDSFTFKVNDGKIDSNTATVSITVNHVNHPPVAQNRTVTTDEDTSKAVTLASTDPDNDPLAYIIVTQPTHGALSGTPPNVTYTPTAHYSGSDSFTFKVNDGKVDSNTATVSITVNHVNHPPVAQNQNVTTDEDLSKAITLVATDPDADVLTYTIVAQPSHGKLTGTPPNVTYMPIAHYYGSDSFTFKTNDGKIDSNVATVSITVNHVNHAPVAQSQSIITDEDAAKLITLVATDPDGDTLTYTIVTQPTHGTLSGTPPNVTYTPIAHYYGSDAFTFKANDETVDSNIGTVSITVNHVNHAPVAQTQSVTTDEDTVKAITLIATDTDNDQLNYAIVAQPGHGTLTGTTPNVTYTPTAQYYGSDSFTFKANDGKVDSNIATVSILVNHINHAPLAQDQAITTSADTAKAINLTGTDVDGDPLTYRVIAQPSHGILSGTAPTLTYTPAAQYSGFDSFTFKVNDGIADSNIATVSITVKINHPPVAQNQCVTTDQDMAKAITLVAKDADGDPLTYQIMNQPMYGTLSGTGPNLTYTPADRYFGPDCFSFKANDGIMDSDIATVSISIIHHAPVAQNQCITTDEDAPKNITLVATNADNTPLTYHIVSLPRHGALSGTPPDVTYTPAAHYSGPDIFTFQASDGKVNSNISSIMITVNPTKTGDIISTLAGLAGNTPFGLEQGDGGPATEAVLHDVTPYVMGLAVDGQGNLYIALDSSIRKVDRSGVINTIAGRNGGYSGDGGLATEALLEFEPQGLAADASGNVYVSTVDRIRKVSSNGIITTIIGNGILGYSGDGGPADHAQLNDPRGLALDTSGNLYIADSDNNRIRKVDTNGIISTVAGNGASGYGGDGGPATEAMLDFPEGVAIDKSGNLYIADTANNRIRKVDTNGIISTVAGNGTSGYGGDGGPATEAMLDSPGSIAADCSGNLYITECDYDPCRIRKVDPNGIIETVGGEQPQFHSPSSVAVDGCSVYFAAVGHNFPEQNIWKLDSSETVAAVAGFVSYSGEAPSINADFDYPRGIAADASGNVYIADQFHNRIAKVDTRGIMTTVVGSDGVAGFRGDGGPANQARLDGPGGLALDASGNLYIADLYNYRIRKMDTNGIITTVAGNGTQGYGGDGGPATQAILNYPEGVALDKSGNLYIADGANHRIRKVDKNGIITTVAGSGLHGYSGDGGLATQAQFYWPTSVALDASGNFYFPDGFHNCVRKVDNNGIIATVAGNGTSGYSGDGGPARGAMLSDPLGVIVDVSENLYIADADNNRIRKVDNNGIITTIVGSGSVGYGFGGYSGDGGPATEALLNYPEGVTLDRLGNLYVLDTSNFVVRKVGRVSVTATITGKVTDSWTGLALSGAAVAITDSLNAVYTGQTDSGGRYTLAGLAQGSFTATFSKLGYVEQTANGTATAGQTVILNAQLTPAPLALNITSPQDGATVYLSPVTVSGTVNHNATVTVNGFQATVTNNTFTASIPLSVGSNAIQAAATDQYGQTASQTIHVLFAMGGMIWGTVTDLSTGFSVPFATISITDFSNNTQTVLADNNGAYLIFGIAPGAFTGTVTQTGYMPYSFSETISPGQTMTLDVGLTFLATMPPTITDVAVGGITTHSATVWWSTDQPANSLVDYGTTTSYGLSAADLTLTRSHTILLNNLAPGTTYHFGVTSTNEFGFSSSSDMSFATWVPGPIAYDDSVTMRGDTAKAIRLSAWDPDNNPLTYQIIAQPTHGMLSGTPPDVTYTPAAHYVGPDSFSFKANNGQIESNIATVSLTVVPPPTITNIISTIVGNGSGSFSGDGGPSTQATVSSPWGIAVDSMDNLYIADTGNRRIRKVDANGNITTVAGGGYGGDGGLATEADLGSPSGVAVDGAGNIFIADSWNHRVRKVDPNGIITTIAGSGLGGFGNGGYGGDNGPATEAMLDTPEDVATDQVGNLYIADTNNRRIRKVDPNGIITTVAGSGMPGSYIADGTPATQAMLQYPEGVAVDALGNLYIADSGGDRILKVDSSGIITIVAGNGSTGYGGDGGPAKEAMLNWPGGVVVDASGNVYIADSGNNLIRRVDPSGIIATVAGTGDSGYSGDGGPAPLAMLNYPEGIALDASGNLYVVDCLNNRIRKIWGLSTPTTGSVAGKVTDSSTGIPLPDVSVTIKDFLNATYATKTGSDGTYTVSGLAPGDFTATFLKSGYIQQTANGISIVGQSQTLDIQLLPVPSLSIAITSPQDGATVNSSPVTVTGNVSNSASVTVNGVQTSVTDNTFSVTIPLSEGSNAIQATATDQYGQTASQTIHVVLALVTGGSIAGTITDSLTGSPLASVTVSVTDAQNLTQTALTDNSGGFTISGIGSGPFTGSITKGGYTTRTFSGTMTSGQTLTLNATMDPILPIITNIAVSGTTMNSATITWATDQLTDSLVEYGTTSSYGSSASDSTFTTTHTINMVGLTPATTYHFRVTSKNGYGISSSSGDGSFTTLTPSPITLTITLPSNNDTISRADTLVKGTIINSIGSETGVVVNGFIANVYGNEFVANHIPLVEGSNTIIANATDASGNIQTASVTVTAITTGDYIKITATPESGISPLDTTVTIDSSLDLGNATFNCSGPGPVEFFPPDANGTGATMTTEGIYYCAATVNDSRGKTYDDTMAITVLSKTEMDALLKVKWDGMKTALYNKDMLTGLNFLLDSSIEEYQEDFNTLLDELPNIISSMQDIEMIYLRDDVAKYRMNRVHDIDGTPVTITYYIYFVKDDNGIWKIQEF
jgi:uncharacterized protein YjiK